MPGLFALTLVLSAFLLFSVQPMIAKEVLPQLGGAPAVWTTCMVFFQAVLLAGYLYAHALTSRLNVRRQVMGHALLLLASIAFLPIGPIGTDSTSLLTGGANPSGRLLLALVGSAGIPLLAVAATAPLLQRWFTTIGHRTSADPYFLYGASNLGSLAALLTYPLAIEPNLALARQRNLWAGGAVVLAGLVFACSVLAGRASNRTMTRTEPIDEPRPEPLAPARWWRWVFLGFVPSSLMLGVTTYISTDIAPVPLLWVIPLAVYLLSFILTFATRPIMPPRWMERGLPLGVMALALILGFGLVQAWWIPLHLLTFFAAAMVCHGELARDRPPPQQLTAFYLAVALGGVLGGAFNALVAPLVFNRIVEYPLALVLACLALPVAARPNARGGRGGIAADGLFGLSVFVLIGAAIRWDESQAGSLPALFASGLVSLACWTHRVRPLRFALTIGAALLASGLTAGLNGLVLHQERNFFGVLQVTFDPQSQSHRLFHGRTLHGQQSLDPAHRREPGSYYVPSGPVGQIFDPSSRPARRNVAVIGLGTGALATYAEPEERWTFYEIDPAVVAIASNPTWFRFLRDSRARSLDVVLGDARIKLAEAPDHTYDLLVLDAFSADAIPMHLLTREALRLYRQKLTATGVLALHISNRSIELESVVAVLAHDAGLECRVRTDRTITPEERRAGKQPTIWAVIAPHDANLGRLATDPRWTTPPRRNGSVWTDDFSGLAGHLVLSAGRFPSSRPPDHP